MSDPVQTSGPRKEGDARCSAPAPKGSVASPEQRQSPTVLSTEATTQSSPAPEVTKGAPVFDPKHPALRPHPLLPLPAPEKMAAELQTPAGQARLLQFLAERQRALDLAAADPLHHRLRLRRSGDVDRLLQQYQLVYEAGGKRAGKTEDGVPRFLECCFAYGKAKRWCMQDNDLSSIANLQQLVWHYLPPSVRALNMKGARDPRIKYRVHYKPDTGFDKLLILPNGCEIYFLNYTQNPSDFLGWKLGKQLDVELNPKIPDIGALLDENCPLTWLENILLRCSDLGAKVHWMYSPQDGITPAIKAVTRGAVTLESEPAELLSTRVNVPGLQKGHMPVIREASFGKVKVGIFHRFTQWNPFSNYGGPGGVRELCDGRPVEYTMRHAYGYCEDVRGRAFPLFGEWNVVKPASIPADGTNYQVTDPAGARNWFTIWARATPGGELWIYREWPDWETFGDWAVTSANPKKLNGDRGPAQPTIGYGPPQYKNLFLGLEKIVVPETVKARFDAAPEAVIPAAEWDELLKTIPDAYHRAAIRRAEGNFANLREVLFERLIDPRAARNQTAADGQGVDLITKLARTNLSPTGTIEAGPMHFQPAPGLDLRDGVSAINELLWFKNNEELTPLLNAPRLFISERCKNLIWAMNTYSLPTDAETTDDACEDPIDCLRYLVTRGVRYIVPGGTVATRGGGSYGGA